MRWYDAPTKSAKRSTFSHKMGVRFKKVHLFGGPAPPQIDPGYGPGKIISLSAIRGWGHLDVMVYT